MDINNSTHGDLETTQGGVENDQHAQKNSNDESNKGLNTKNIENIVEEMNVELESIQGDEDDQIMEEGEET